MKDSKLISGICGLTANTVDWIRSIYFSLFGSSMLTLMLKISTFDSCIILYFTLGIFCFLIGLIFSSKIAGRFKDYEKNYDKEDQDTILETSRKNYFIDCEKKNKEFRLYTFITLLLFSTVWLPALIFICIAGYKIETKSTISNKTVNDKLDVVKKNIILKCMMSIEFTFVYFYHYFYFYSF